MIWCEFQMVLWDLQIISFYFYLDLTELPNIYFNLPTKISGKVLNKDKNVFFEPRLLIEMDISQ